MLLACAVLRKIPTEKTQMKKDGVEELTLLTFTILIVLVLRLSRANES
jgi:hypothetical protein